MESQEPTNDNSSQDVSGSIPTHGQEADTPERNDKATIFESGDDAATADLNLAP